MKISVVYAVFKLATPIFVQTAFAECPKANLRRYVYGIDGVIAKNIVFKLDLQL